MLLSDLMRLLTSIVALAVGTVYPRLIATGKWANLIECAHLFSEQSPLELNVISWLDNAGKQTFFKLRLLDHSNFHIWPRNRSPFETLMRYVGGEHHLDQVYECVLDACV